MEDNSCVLTWASEREEGRHENVKAVSEEEGERQEGRLISAALQALQDWRWRKDSSSGDNTCTRWEAQALEHYGSVNLIRRRRGTVAADA